MLAGNSTAKLQDSYPLFDREKGDEQWKECLVTNGAWSLKGDMRHSILSVLPAIAMLTLVVCGIQSPIWASSSVVEAASECSKDGTKTIAILVKMTAVTEKITIFFTFPFQFRCLFRFKKEIRGKNSNPKSYQDPAPSYWDPQHDFRINITLRIRAYSPSSMSGSSPNPLLVSHGKWRVLKCLMCKASQVPTSIVFTITI